MTIAQALDRLPAYAQLAAARYRLARHLPIRHTFTPLPWAEAAYKDTFPVLLFTGSAGGGKSRLAAEMLHRYLMHYPNAAGLALRKAREYTRRSIVPFLWHTVMAADHAWVTLNRSDWTFYYQNGSVLYVGGMQGDEQREALRSIGRAGGLDVIWMEEATGFSEQDYNELLARLRGTAGPYRQILLTTNPDAPTHWIHRRLILGGEAHVYYSHAVDNPYNSPEYLETLQRLTGILRQRLVEGRWVQAEGIIYDSFSPERHVTPSAEYVPDLPVIWGVDDGYVRGGGEGTPGYHPRVILFLQVMPTGVVHVFDEYTATEELSETSIQMALARPYARPICAYVDSSATELRARLWGIGIQTVSASHRVHEGIKVVRSLLGDATSPIPALRIHPRCGHLIREFQAYAWRESAAAGEPQPIKANDHGLDALRYAVYHLRHQVTRHD